MFERSRKISLIVAPHGSAKSWNRTVPLPVLMAAGASLVLLLILLLALLVGVAELSSEVREIADLQAENATLRQQSVRVSHLEAELTRLREMETRVRHWAGIPPGGVAAAGSEAEAAWAWERDEQLLAEVPTLAPVDGWVSRGFEVGTDGHPGIDLVEETGTPVRASARGVVQLAGWDEVLGNLVVLDHGNGLVSRYGHNDTLLVKAGEEVLRGAPIARIGTTGRSSAPHLHFEVRREDEPLNPAYLLVSET